MISFIIPCHNEEKNIKNTLTELFKAIKILKLKFYEIIIVDDLSTDDTIKKAKKFSKKSKIKIIIIKNKKNLGYGGAVKEGIKRSKKKFTMWLPGDDGFEYRQYLKIIPNIEKFDIIGSYFINANKRTFYRRFFTSFYTPLLNLIFGLKLPYYNGLTIFRTDILKQIDIKFDSHIFQVEIWCKIKILKIKPLIKFVQLRNREEGQVSEAFRFKNSMKVLYCFLYLTFYSLFHRI
jgi:glycosyltransferase involved in cell wall biosynthesis